MAAWRPSDDYEPTPFTWRQDGVWIALIVAAVVLGLVYLYVQANG